MLILAAKGHFEQRLTDTLFLLHLVDLVLCLQASLFLRDLQHPLVLLLQLRLEGIQVCHLRLIILSILQFSNTGILN